MKIDIILVIAVILAMVCYSYFTERRIKNLQAERDKYLHNTETLLGDVQKFMVRDSLHAARVTALELSIKEYERYRAEDASLINQLKAKNRDLESISKAQTQTIIELSTMAKDTVILHDSIPVPALALHAGDAYYDFYGVLDGRKFTGSMTSRDSLIVAESVQYKRFLFWKTKRVKNREIDIVNKNPHSVIQGLEFVTIEK